MELKKALCFQNDDLIFSVSNELKNEHDKVDFLPKWQNNFVKKKTTMKMKQTRLFYLDLLLRCSTQK